MAKYLLRHKFYEALVEQRQRKIESSLVKAETVAARMMRGLEESSNA